MIVIIVTKAIPPHLMRVMILEKKQPATGLLLWMPFEVLADELKKFASFLTVRRKCNYTCVYIFHIIYPEKTILRTVLSQTNILNIFPISVSLSQVKRILESVCIRKTRKYILLSSLWISRLFIELLVEPIGSV